MNHKIQNNNMSCDIRHVSRVSAATKSRRDLADPDDGTRDDRRATRKRSCHCERQYGAKQSLFLKRNERLPRLSLRSRLAMTVLISIFFISSSFSASAEQRIVSLAPSITEILFAIGAGDQVVGVTTYCHYPPEAEQLPKVGAFTDHNVEAILQTRPQLIVMTPNSGTKNLHEHLKSLKIEILVLPFYSLEDFMQSIEQLGQKTQHVQEATQLQQEFKTLLNKVRVELPVSPSFGGLFTGEEGEVGKDVIPTSVEGSQSGTDPSTKPSPFVPLPEGEETGEGDSRLRMTEKRGEETGKERPIYPKVAYVTWRSPLILSGTQTLEGEIVAWLGGDNVADNASVRYPHWSLESLLATNPDLIIDATAHERTHLTEAEQLASAKKFWGQYPALKAVQNNEVYVFYGDALPVPGPRTKQLIQRLSLILKHQIQDDETGYDRIKF